MAARIHFKLDYNGDIQKFASTLHDDELLRAVKAKVASIVQKETYRLFWKNEDSNVVLDSDDDLKAAIEYAKCTRKNASKVPCVLLVVDAPMASIMAEEEDAKKIAETAFHRAATVEPEEIFRLSGFQEHILEERFWKRGCSIYPQKQEMEKIAASIAMTADQVNEWFKARRAEMRRAAEMKIQSGSKNLNKSAQTASDIEMNEAFVKAAMQALDKFKAYTQALKAAAAVMEATPESDIKADAKPVIPAVEQEWVRLEAEWNESVALAVAELEKKKDSAQMGRYRLDSSEDEETEEEQGEDEEEEEEEDEDDLSTAYEPSLTGSEDSDEESEDECETAVELSEDEEKVPMSIQPKKRSKKPELHEIEAALEAREEHLARRMAEFAVMMDEYEGKMTTLMGRVEDAEKAENEDMEEKMDDIEERLGAIEEMY